MYRKHRISKCLLKSYATRPLWWFGLLSNYFILVHIRQCSHTAKNVSKQRLVSGCRVSNLALAFVIMVQHRRCFVMPQSTPDTRKVVLLYQFGKTRPLFEYFAIMPSSFVISEGLKEFYKIFDTPTTQHLVKSQNSTP